MARGKQAGGEKRRRAKTAREKKTGWRGGRAEESDGDSENARAKGYEMKFSSHPFCVSEGIPVRQEVPSWNQRKGKSRACRQRESGRENELA